MITQPEKIIISASRRTDIPAFYMDWFMDRIQKGAFKVVNPFNRKISRVPAAPDHVDTFVFWSKDFHLFLKNGYGLTLEKMGYNLFFNFTINSMDSMLEPRAKSLHQRLDQLMALSDAFGPDAVHWRFDPVCFYETGDGKVKNNLLDFNKIAKTAHQCGITTCITSFMDDYAKIQKRTKTLKDFSFVFPDMDKKRKVLEKMESRLLPLGIRLLTCCENQVMAEMDGKSTIEPSACIPGEKIARLFGGNVSSKKDKGQRSAKGCQCTVSKDIGSYALHPCHNNCLYCYANPSGKINFN